MSKKKKMMQAAEAERQAREERAARQAELDAIKLREEKEKTETKPRPTAMEEYYNIAYAAERKRLNKIFGHLAGGNGYFPDEPEKVFIEKEVRMKPDMIKFVLNKRLKAANRRAGWTAAFMIIFLLVAMFFAAAYFKFIALPF